MVGVKATAALIVPRAGTWIWGQLAPEDKPPDEGGIAIRGMRLIRSVAPFEALSLRADTAPVTVTVYQGNRVSGVVYFGRSPFRLRAPGPVEIEVSYVLQLLNGGASGTAFAGLAVFNCGGVAADSNLSSIDGRVQ